MIGAIVLLVGFFSVKTFVDAGQFKTIEPHFNGSCEQIHGLEGPEDIVTTSDGKVFISSDPRRKILSESLSMYSHEKKDSLSNQGAIFYYDINNRKLKNLTSDLGFEFHPHGISIFETLTSTYLSAVNHTSKGHSIVLFEFKNNMLIFKKSIKDPMLISPNDIVLISEDEFYVTNDHGSKKMRGKLIEDYLQLSRSNVLHYDGQKFKIVVSNLQYANGVNINKSKDKLYVSESIGKKITIYDINTSTNDVSLFKTIDIDSGLDNIEVDLDGNLWIGSHPRMFDFIKHAKNEKNLSPSQVIMVSGQNYEVKEIFLNDGTSLSGSSVASYYNNNLLIGAVFEDNFLHCVLE